VLPEPLAMAGELESARFFFEEEEVEAERRDGSTAEEEEARRAEGATGVDEVGVAVEEAETSARRKGQLKQEREVGRGTNTSPGLHPIHRSLPLSPASR
jgi:hypothetical protein